MKNIKSGTTLIWVAGILAVLCVESSSAEMIVNYQFSGDLRPSSIVANVTAGDFGSGAGFKHKVGAEGAGDFSGVDAQGNAGFSTDRGTVFSSTSVGVNRAPDNTQALAFSEGEYFTFTVSAKTGFQLNLTRLTFKGGRNNGRAAEVWVLTSSIDGHAAGNIIASGEITATSSAGTFDSFVVNLSGAQYQNIGSTTEVEFHLYIYGADHSKKCGTYFDNVVLNGTVVPNSGTLGLITARAGSASCFSDAG